MIWFDGDADYPDWNVGDSSDFQEGKYTRAWIASNDDTKCPEMSEEWEEWFNSEWQISPDASIRLYSPALGIY